MTIPLQSDAWFPQTAATLAVRELHERLADLLRQLPPDRQEAFLEYLDERVKQIEHGDAGA